MWDGKMTKHPVKALSSIGIKSLKKPGRYADGNGLYLVVDPSGAKRWVLRTVVQGRRRDIGLGGLQVVPLAEARDLASNYRKSARNGGDPLTERRKARTVVLTFEKAAAAVHEEHKAAWKNAKHIDQWINTLTQYAFPELGERRVDQIDTPDIVRVLSPIWLTKPETARRVRQRIGTVLDWAKASGLRDGENPVAGVGKGLPKQNDQAAHHKAIPYNDVPAFVQALQSSSSGETVKLAFEFLILTATRTNEVIGCRWDEIDFDSNNWTIPAKRMKAKKIHVVPLARRCVAILRRTQLLSGGSDFAFPGRSIAKPLSNMALLMTMRGMSVDATVHGFRSSFADWAAEQTNFPREVCEEALAHTIANKTEAAYRRSDFLDKRRALMQQWAAYCGRKNANAIIKIR
jgi:integrase